MAARPLEIRLLQDRSHAESRPEHHIIPSQTTSAGWASYLPSWDPTSLISRPKKTSDKSSAAQNPLPGEERYKDIAGFRNPWPSWHKPTQQEVWDSLAWGADPDPTIDLAASHLNDLPATPKPERSRRPTFSDIDDWPRSTGAKAARLLQVERPDFTFPSKGANDERVQVTWLGHAGMLLQLAPSTPDKQPIRILFDPIFSQRCSPTQAAGPVRTYPPPCAIADLPPIDLFFMSHNHYDHLDYDSLQAIWKRDKERMRVIAPLANLRWFVECGIPAERVTELDWWEGVEIQMPSTKEVVLKITCTPAQHSSGRTGMDTDSTLWSSWYLEHLRPDEKPFRIYFAGDTGYQFHHSRNWPPPPPATSSTTSPSSAKPTARSSTISLPSLRLKSRTKSFLLRKSRVEGDTEYPACPAFAEIHRRLGPPHLLLMPVAVGATYAWFRSFFWVPDWLNPIPTHASGVAAATHMPAWDAVRVLRVLLGHEEDGTIGGLYTPEDAKEQGSKVKGNEEEDHKAVAIAMHWGTFVPDAVEVLRTLGQLEWACEAHGVRFARSLESTAEAMNNGGKPTFLAVNHGQTVTL
jgi:N-acyl-phosphatidylethanolamine-hydrolysing phospholipase D